MAVGEYLSSVIERGDAGSALLAERTVQTLQHPLVDFIGRKKDIPVVRFPENKEVVVHTAVGCQDLKNPTEIAASLVDSLTEDAYRLNAIPVAFANVIDSQSGDLKMLENIAEGLVQQSLRREVAIVNGENAILGNRLTVPFTISGTMVSMRPFQKKRKEEGIEYTTFAHNNKPVFLNSDGVGTKTEFYERNRRFHLGLQDSLAMKMDDAVKLGAEVKVVADVVQTRGSISMDKLGKYAETLGMQYGCKYVLYHEPNAPISGYGHSNLNIAGTAVSLVDEKILDRLHPQEGNVVLALRGQPNPRSNGISAKRENMEKILGKEWHKETLGKIFLQYLATPSTVFYPVCKKLMDQDCATAFFHMSGGAYKGKLAHLLAKERLFVQLKNLFPPDWRELALAGFSLMPSEVAYAQWPMGNEGFVAVRPDLVKEACHLIASAGLELRVVGGLEHAFNYTGVEFRDVKDSSGRSLYFSGK